MPDDHPTLPAARADLDDLVMWSVIRAARGFEQRFTELLAPHDLTPVQFGAIAQLAIEPFLTQAQLAHRILMRPQSASHLLDVLIGRGLVERTAARGSGRPNPVRLTPAGRALLARVWPVVVAANTPAALGLRDRQHQQLSTVVRQVVRDQERSDRSTP